jgi:hypothetical protein
MGSWVSDVRPVRSEILTELFLYQVCEEVIP